MAPILAKNSRTPLAVVLNERERGRKRERRGGKRREERKRQNTIIYTYKLKITQGNTSIQHATCPQSIPEIGGIHFSYNECCDVPPWYSDGLEYAQYEDCIHFSTDKEQ